MSKRVVAIKILGLGDTSSVNPAVFTTREIAGFSTLVPGTVVSLSDQLSSEIQVFGSLGSDSTTSFTVLSTPATRRLLLSRGKREVYDAALHQPVRLIGYVLPAAGTVEIPVPNPALFTVSAYYRVQNTVFKIVSNSPVLTGVRVWGCANVPIGMTAQGVGNEPLGSIVYDLNGGNPLGGCEQLPVVITTSETNLSDEKLIFRGYVNKVSNDTSAGQQNLIKVDCSSMMAYLKQAPFIPAWGPVTVSAIRDAGSVYNAETNSVVLRPDTTTPWEAGVYGPRYNPILPKTGETAVKLWQLREKDNGGIGVPLAFDSERPDVIIVNNDITLDWGTNVATTTSYPMSFVKGYYDVNSKGPIISVDATFNGLNRAAPLYSTTMTPQSATMRGENCLEAVDFPSLIVDLLLGSYSADLTLYLGARAPNESAWLPFPIDAISDIIDMPSLNALTKNLVRPDVVTIDTELILTQGNIPRVVLPYEHESAKTVADVLDGILKRLGAYMVYDQGKFCFGSWSGVRAVPALVSDAALSDPSIKLTFERGLCLMRVTAKYCTQVSPEVVTYDVPYLNIDLASSGLGKEMTIGHWFSGQGANPDDPSWGNTQMMANAFGLIMRYSQSAARVDLSLRDSQLKLIVGQEVALTSDYLVNSEGELGVQALTGYVLKAARSWQTPTTAYTIILPGYVSPDNKIPVWSCSALVEDVPGGDLIQVGENVFTAGPDDAQPGQPTCDANAFELTYQRNGSWYEVQLLDQYGTFKYQGQLKGVSGNYLNLPGFEYYAVPGDIIVLADASYFGSININAIYDVFQADDAAQVDGSTNNARKWVR